MALTVQQLTDDGSFLLNFEPSFAPAGSTKRFPGSLRVLIDPWLHGGTTILHPRFATTNHTTKPSISSLAEIQDKIDVILISQEKADHMHKETLCTLPKDTRIRIVATPKAARLILSWEYFDHPEIVQVLGIFNEKKPGSAMRIPLAPFSSTSAEGEVTIANIPQRRDVAGIHNAFGITYRPPGSVLTAPDGRKFSIADMPMLSSPHYKLVENAQSAPLLKRRYLKGSLEEVTWTNHAVGTLDFATDVMKSLKLQETSSQSRVRHQILVPKMTSLSHSQNCSEKVLSVIYTPHGTDAASLQPYVHSHLARMEAAIPVTALIHSLTFETNPWWMAGVVCAGAPGGVQIAHDFGAKYWISAHDEPKDSGGVATKLIKCKRYNAQEVTEMLREAGGIGTGSDADTEVVILKGGEMRRFTG